MTRKLEDWISSFEQYTSILSSPAIFRKWAGISLVAAALERKVWIETSVGILYPNLYVFFVGPPAVGKTVPINLVWRMMTKALTDHKVSSSSVTRATVIEELAEADRFKSTPAGAIKFNSLYVVSNELGVLLPEYGTEFMSKLTDLYDCLPYSERRRNAKHNAAIEKPQLNLLAGTQPGYLINLLPEVAWEQGFLSRVILVYAGEPIRQSLFSRTEQDTVLWEKIVHDLQRIGAMYGEFRFTEEVKVLLDEFFLGGDKRTAPLHPKLQNYNNRRPAHLMKLMQVASAATGDTYVIDVEHFQMAMDWLIEAEHTMPEIFKAMNSGGDNSIMRETWYYVYERQAANGKAVQEDHVVAFLAQRVPAEKIKWILDVMKSAGLLKVEITGGPTMYRAVGSPT